VLEGRRWSNGLHQSVEAKEVRPHAPLVIETSFVSAGCQSILCCMRTHASRVVSSTCRRGPKERVWMFMICTRALVQHHSHKIGHEGLFTIHKSRDSVSMF
jgi:hypothetical protein